MSDTSVPWELYGRIVDETKMVAVRDLNINTKAYSRGIKKEKLRVLKKSIIENGWFPNQKLVATPDYQLIDGNHRTQSYKDIGKPNKLLPVTIVEPYSYQLEADLFLLLNKHNPKLGSLDWWKAHKEKGDLLANLIWRLNSDPPSSFNGKVRLINSKSRPFSITTVCDIIKCCVFQSREHYTRVRDRHNILDGDLRRVAYETVRDETNRYVDFVEKSFYPFHREDNPVPYYSKVQRSILDFYVLLLRNNRLNAPADMRRLITQSRKVQLAQLKRDGMNITFFLLKK